MDSPVSEFRLIHDYFTARQVEPPGLVVAIGDDAAVMDWPPGRQLVVCADTLNEGVHFPDHTDPCDIGWKALAVNLSDLAAMGARARYFTLSLSLPAADPDWIRGFSTGLFAAAEQFNIILVGGDTTRGPLSIAITAFGEVAPGAAVRRSGARPGDDIWVTGTLGDAAAGLKLLQAGVAEGEDALSLRRRLDRPEPRLAWGAALAELATAMIDVSDGLCADLGHILESSGVGATLDTVCVPLSAALQNCVDPAQALHLALTGGDDYELCFTVAGDGAATLRQLCEQQRITATRIGHIEPRRGLRLIDAQGNQLKLTDTGWDHFA